MSKVNLKYQSYHLYRLFLYILMIIVAIGALFPIAFTILSSLRTQVDLFTNTKPFSIYSIIPKEFTLENFIIIFEEYGFARPVLNTVIVTALTIALGLLVNSVGAFSFSTFDFRGRRMIYSIVLFSFMVPFEAIAIPLYSTVSRLNLIETYSGVFLPAVANGLVVMLFVQFFKDIPWSVIESSRIDGANWLEVFVLILMPMTKTVFITAGLMLFMSQWNSYLWPLLVARTSNLRTIQIAISQFTGERGVHWTYIFAASVISMMVPIMLFIPLQKHFVEGITSGSVKG